MTNTAEKLLFSAEDFLRWESLQAEKHEFIQGEVFAMGGARREHVVVAGNVFALLKQHLRGTPCQPYIADMKLRIEMLDAFFYPDVMVSCHENDRQAEQYLSHPTVIIEVLSDSTEAYDRGAKFAAYRLLPSLKEYMLVDIKAQRLEIFRRTDNDDWLLHVCEASENGFLTSLEVNLNLEDVFEGI